MTHVHSRLNDGGGALEKIERIIKGGQFES
jgi:hypothetical protein